MIFSEFFEVFKKPSLLNTSDRCFPTSKVVVLVSMLLNFNRLTRLRSKVWKYKYQLLKFWDSSIEVVIYIFHVLLENIACLNSFIV